MIWGKMGDSAYTKGVKRGEVVYLGERVAESSTSKLTHFEIAIGQ